MARTALIDSGPIVAALRTRDKHHAWARAHFEAARVPFRTCEAVISECIFLLDRSSEGTEAFCRILERGIIVVDFSLPAELPEVLRLICRYDEVPMSLADACLVRMTEQNSDASVLTMDSDFRIYRKNGRQVIQAILPD